MLKGFYIKACLIRPDSHITNRPFKGLTIKRNGRHFLTQRALVTYPELRVKGCYGCELLNKRVESN